MNPWLRGFLIQTSLLGGSLVAGLVACELLFPTNSAPRIAAIEEATSPAAPSAAPSAGPATVAHAPDSRSP